LTKKYISIDILLASCKSPTPKLVVRYEELYEIDSVIKRSNPNYIHAGNEKFMYEC